MQTKHQLLLILSVALLPLSTQAQAGNGAQNKSKGNPPAPSVLLERMDRDQNGRISRDEAGPRLAGQFDRIDANKDGAITEEELTAARQQGQRTADKAREKMRDVDTDGNGAISRDEAEAADRRRLVGRFDEIDTDGDGELSKKELRTFRNAMKAHKQGNRAEGF